MPDPIGFYIGRRYQPQLLDVPQPEHPALPNALKSIPEEILKPYSAKSTFMGCAFSRKSLSIIYLNPSISYVLSVSLGSSRAMAKEGPPQPPSFKKILMGVTSLSLKYSAICSLADVVTSTILFPPLSTDLPDDDYSSGSIRLVILWYKLITHPLFVNR